MRKLSESERTQAMGRAMKGRLTTQFDYDGYDNVEGMPLWRHLRAMKRCNRMSGVPTIKPYDVATHCYYVGLLFEEVAAIEGIELSRSEIEFVYRHDVFETVTGDLLLPAKTHSPEVERKWDEIEREIVQAYPHLAAYCDGTARSRFGERKWNLFKACDLFELYLFCREEKDYGNRHYGIDSVIHNCRELIPTYGIDYLTRIVTR